MEKEKVEQTDVADETQETQNSEKELETKVQTKLTEVFGGQESTPDNSTDEEVEGDSSTPTESTESDAKESDDDSDSGEDSREEAADDKSETDKSTSESVADEHGIPDALYRAAIHSEWTPEDIKSFYEKSPDLALKTFEKLHKSMNTLTKEFAALGRSKMKLAQTSAAEPDKKKSDEKPAAKIDLTKIKEEYGDDPVVAVLEAVVAQNEILQKRLEAAPVKEDSAVEERNLQAKLEEQQRLRDEIADFFASGDMTPYKELYGEGKDFKKITGEQNAARFKVLEEADAILIGADMRGVKMTTAEAMEKAHLIVSEPVKAKVIREELKAKVVKRAKGMTLKPTGGKAPAEGKVKTADDLEKKVAARLQKVFG